VAEEAAGTRPLVSAVIPVYNGARFVAEAVRSVLEQTYEPIECIVVDDGSTDDTAEIVRGLGGGVRLVQTPNGGVARARNRGVEHARGELLAFLDADDLWRPDKIERQVELLLERPEVGFVYTDLEEIDGAGRPRRYRRAPEPESALRNTVLMEGDVMNVTTSGLIRRTVFAAAGGFDERLSTSADSDLGCRIASSFPIARIPEPLACYRIHANQMHDDLGALEHDMAILHRKRFGTAWPGDGPRLRRRAVTNLEYTLGLSHLHEGLYGRGARHLLRAVASDPPRVAELATRGVKRRLAPEPGPPDRVVFFTPGHSEPGGAGRRSRLIAEGLADRGFEVRVVARAGTLRRPLVRRAPNLTVVEVPGFERPALGAGLFLGTALVLGTLWGRGRSVFMALQLSSPSLAAGLCAAVLRRPFLALSSTSGLLSEVDWVFDARLSPLRQALFRRAAFLVAQTTEGALEFGRLTSPSRIVTVPNPVEIPPPPPLNGAPRALFSGRFSSEKGLVDLLDAWRTVVGRIPGARLTLVGTGGAYRPIEAELRELVAADPALAASVGFTGWVPDVGPLLAENDVYVFPSLGEGMSNALLEACAWRRVVVASDNPSNVAILGEDHPLLYPAGDHDRLAEALERAFTDEATRRRAVDRLEEMLAGKSVEAVATRFEELILAAAAAERPECRASST
jgi:glycosyltransferase involved in cell wall biosynthesis